MTGFIRRYMLHAEWRPGYRPHLSIRRAPRHGDRVVDGDEPGKLARCIVCGGDGFLFEADTPRTGAEPGTTRPHRQGESHE